MAAKARADLGKRAAENKTKGDAFLAQNKGKPGVKVLPSGVQYREIEPGTGPSPSEANQVTIEFRNTLPDGTVLADTSMASVGQPAGPVTLRVSEIPFFGLREALVRMRAGARWEVVLPGNTAHGTSIESAGEMANQVVIIDIKLRSVGPVVAPTQKP
jgi:FKBP-type peptidyl-prolyl cis-trans isomerase